MDRSNGPDSRGPAGDVDDREGGKTAPGEPAGTRGQLDSAGGGYGSESGNATSGGSGEGEPTDEGAGGTDASSTDWLREG